MRWEAIPIARRKEHHGLIVSKASTIDEIIEEIETTKQAERAGRLMDHETEDAFEKLRTGGYM